MTAITARAERKRGSRQRIVEAAARLIRSRGTRGAGVAEVMRAAGLTHGAFYSHFPDKEALVAEALVLATEHRGTWLRGDEEPDARRWIGRVAARYLSPAHRDRPEEGCPYPAVIAELAGSRGPAGAALRRELDRTMTEIAQGLRARDAANPDDTALALTALLVGAMQVARAADEPRATEVLMAARRLAVDAVRGPRGADPLPPETEETR